MANAATSTPVVPLPINPAFPYGYTMADYSRRGKIALSKANKSRERCARCGRWCNGSGIGRHLNYCHGPRNVPYDPNARAYHDTCGCGRFKASTAHRCFHCSGDSDLPEFRCLAILCTAHIDTPRGKLAQAGVPVDDPQQLEVWMLSRKAAEAAESTGILP